MKKNVICFFMVLGYNTNIEEKRKEERGKRKEEMR